MNALHVADYLAKIRLMPFIINERHWRRISTEIFLTILSTACTGRFNQ
jgi:hypothetical protein